MAAQRLVRCDQGHVFDAGAGPACPECGWRMPDAGDGLARPNERAGAGRGPILAGGLALVLAVAAGVWLLRGGPAEAPPGTTAEDAESAASEESVPAGDPPEIAEDVSPPEGRDSEAEPVASGEANGPLPDEGAKAEASDSGGQVPDAARPVADLTQGAQDAAAPEGPGGSGSKEPEADPEPGPEDGTGTTSDERIAEQGQDGTESVVQQVAIDPTAKAAPDSAVDLSVSEASAAALTEPSHRDHHPDKSAPSGQAASPDPAGTVPGDAEPPFGPAIDDTEADLALLREPTGSAEATAVPEQPEPALATLLSVAPERLAAARRALSVPPQTPLPEGLDSLSPQAEAERALGLSHALRHALALARAERAAARGDVATAGAAFVTLAADATVAAGAPNHRALFGLAVVRWQSPAEAERAEGARLLRTAAEQGGMTGAVDLLLSDRALLSASGLAPETLEPVLETAYLQNPARFAAYMAGRGIDTGSLGYAAASLRGAARSGDTRAFAHALGGVGQRQAPVLESLLAVTLEADAKLRPTPRAAERQVVAALVAALAGVTDGRVALAMIAERGQAGVPAHLPGAVLWLVLALSDLDPGHPQRAGIDRLLRDWAARLPPGEAAQVARIASGFGVR